MANKICKKEKSKKKIRKAQKNMYKNKKKAQRVKCCTLLWPK